MNNKDYRNEIDGLRALAVLSVIIYHLQIDLLNIRIFSGGFLGVDIFFLISGYLITKILIHELDCGNILLANFYIKRVKRILPALIFCKIIFFPIAIYLLLPNDLIQYSKSILYSSFFSSNFFFYFENLSYEAEDSLLLHFLHTWSLSIEEQFYFIYPLILIIFTRKIKDNWKLVITILFLASLIFSFFNNYTQSFNFYIIFSRMWELLFGGLIFLIEHKVKKNKKNYQRKYLDYFMPKFGLILVILPIFLLNDEIFFPNLFIFTTLLGTGILIIFIKKNEITYSFLSSLLMKKIGIISYSLYLFHFPIFAFFRIYFDEYSLNLKIVSIMILFSVAILSYKMIERPFRFEFSTKKSITLISIFFLISLFLNFYVIKNEGFEDRMPKILSKNHKIDDYRKIIQDDKSCHSRERIFCTFYNNNKKDIFLIGDSHSDASLKSFLDFNYIKDNFKVTHMSISGSPFIENLMKINKKTKNVIQKNYMKNRINYINGNKNSIFIHYARMPLYLSSTYFDNKEGGIEHGTINDDFFIKSNLSFEDALRETFLKIAENNILIIVYPIPEVGWNVPQKIYNQILKNTQSINDFSFSTSLDVYKKRSESSFLLLDSIQHDNIYRVYPHEIFCDLIEGRCKTHNKIDVYYSDDDHPSYYGSYILNQEIVNIIKEL